MIAGISMLFGCKSLSGKLQIDTPFIDVEYEGTPQ